MDGDKTKWNTTGEGRENGEATEEPAGESRRISVKLQQSKS